MRRRGGISPFLAVVILIVIALIFGLLLFNWFGGWFGDTLDSTTAQLVYASASVDKDGGDYILTLRVQNGGGSNIVAMNLTLLGVQVNGSKLHVVEGGCTWVGVNTLYNVDDLPILCPPAVLESGDSVVIQLTLESKPSTDPIVSIEFEDGRVSEIEAVL